MRWGLQSIVTAALALGLVTTATSLAQPAAPAEQLLKDRLECYAGADQTCTETISLKVEGPVQACKVLYDRSSTGSVSHSFTPAEPIADEPGRSAGRFAGYTLRMRAYGSNSILDRRSARLTLLNIRVVTLPLDATDEDRRRAGCDMLRPA